jgi:hypothetical protein
VIGWQTGFRDAACCQPRPLDSTLAVGGKINAVRGEEDIFQVRNTTPAFSTKRLLSSRKNPFLQNYWFAWTRLFIYPFHIQSRPQDLIFKRHGREQGGVL